MPHFLKRRNRRVAPAPESNGDKPKEIPKQPRGRAKTQNLCQQVEWFGFRNPGNLCYVNSSLQSLITLKGFINDIIMQVEVWKGIAEAQLIRAFINILILHRSTDAERKCQAVYVFKCILSKKNPEFQNQGQKDAHEFIVTVLDQLRNLAPLLRQEAALVGRKYRCPVEEHFIFKMESTRTCKGCGAQSSRDEEFSNLSLNLVPGASVQDVLQNYLKETDIDFNCGCGAKRSGQQSSFATLPKILMLHLKRFTYSRPMQLEKLHCAVDVFRELMVTSRQGDGWYSLVSVVSHLGIKGQQVDLHNFCTLRHLI
ncbi:ubiquitin carboxyl-terminal hydrolase 37-like [Scomber japonicus]|uniref:ubiquitin carboxyl-terminal hydrolase 37-like n=1 Tax=Scomber japonicus TaxID=13676 RepID=UPI002304FF23|nr:ubiquitin carboxyl-terminal hydrolase 37-like [Scomber japonicus]